MRVLGSSVVVPVNQPEESDLREAVRAIHLSNRARGVKAVDGDEGLMTSLTPLLNVSARQVSVGIIRTATPRNPVRRGLLCALFQRFEDLSCSVT